MDFANHFPRSILGAFACLLTCSCGGADNQDSPPSRNPLPKVTVWEAVPGAVETRRSWPATVEPLRVLEVVAPANGRLTKSSINAGDRVEAGAIVMVLHFPESEAIRESIARRAELLEQEAARLELLVANRSVSAAEAAAMRIEQLETEAELRAIEALLEEGALLAPVAGIVLETLASAGSTVVEGTVLARIADAASHGVRLDVPNPELRHFENIESLAVATDTPLTIERIVRHSGVRQNTTRIELWLAPEAGSAAPAAATVTHKSSREALLIPWSAVATDDDRAWVGRVDRKTHEVRRVDVVLGATSGTGVEVVEGLSSGDWVLRHDPRTFADGAVVAPEPTTPPEGR